MIFLRLILIAWYFFEVYFFDANAKEVEIFKKEKGGN